MVNQNNDKYRRKTLKGQSFESREGSRLSVADGRPIGGLELISSSHQRENPPTGW